MFCIFRSLGLTVAEDWGLLLSITLDFSPLTGGLKFMLTLDAGNNPDSLVFSGLRL